MLRQCVVLWLAIVSIGLPRAVAIEVSESEYQACRAKEDAAFLVNCYRESLAEDMGKSRAELPVMPTKEERVRNCQANLAIAKGAWKLYPDPCRSRR